MSTRLRARAGARVSRARARSSKAARPTPGRPTRPGVVSLFVVRRAKAAVALTALFLLLSWAVDIAWARPEAIAVTVFVLVLGTLALAIALLVDEDRTFAGAFVTLTAAAAFAGLPPGRPHAGIEAAVAGALLLGLAESASWARAGWPPAEGGARTAARRARWVAGVAAAGVAVGWGATALSNEVGGLGSGAIALGALAAVACVALTAALARSALRA